jgi:hypothetical protein
MPYSNVVRVGGGCGPLYLFISEFAIYRVYAQMKHNFHGGQDDLILSAKLIRIAPETSSF